MPTVEAFHKRVPVLAYAATAVPSTMDGGGVLYESKDPVHVASLLQAILDDEGLVERILTAQDAALTRLEAQDFDGTLLRFVDQAIAAPPGVAPRVSFDFWDQFELQEQLEEVRQYRPSALRALPKAESGVGSRESGVAERPEAGHTPSESTMGSSAPGPNPESRVPSSRP